MKTRIVSSVALAAVIAIGATGCSLIAHQGTSTPYAPSDGIDANADAVEVRNLMLVISEEAGVLNTVFTAVNSSDTVQELSMTIVTSDNKQTVHRFSVEPGISRFGDPTSELDLAIVEDPNALAGTNASVYLQSGKSSEVQREVPILDGTLAEYASYVLSAAQLKKALPATDELTGEEVPETDVESAPATPAE